MTKASTYREQSNEELDAELLDLRKKMFELKNAISSKKEDVKPIHVQQKRRDVARILTIKRERQQQ